MIVGDNMKIGLEDLKDFTKEPFIVLTSSKNVNFIKKEIFNLNLQTKINVYS